MPSHLVLRADPWRVPPPFRSFAVRSEEPRHAALARAPYPCVHVLQADFIAPDAQARIVALGRSRMAVRSFSDIAYAPVSVDELQAAGATAIVPRIAGLLQRTKLLGDDLQRYLDAVGSRIDFLGCHGAGFHNDVAGHWTACLFWNLALAAHEVEFVMPHASLRVAVKPGELMVFDPALAHGLCRSGDAGQARHESFPDGDDASAVQVFLSGELPLSDAQWAAAGAPWLPLAHHREQGALELVAAAFDERTGAVQRVRALADCLLDSTHYG